MTSARRRALLVVGAAIAAIAVLAALGARTREPLPPRPPADRPTLLLLTSLPLMFGEGFSLQATGSNVMKALSARYKVVPVSVTAPSELAKGRLLLMAHPLAQSPQNLVALDEWVRRGGRVLLLADPMLEWPSERPLGDALRPPPDFADTGLLAHWGLRLEAPDEQGPARRELGGYDVLTVSPGSLSGACKISADRLVARCVVGRGEATVVADADLLDVSRLDEGAKHNLDGLNAELASLEHG